MTADSESASGSLCPLTGLPGRVRSTRTAEDLLASYRTHTGLPLPDALARSYVRDVTEYECRESGLRWFSPMILGGPDYYEWLGASFDWYYAEDTWDKKEALRCLARRRVRKFLEIGSGDGSLLSAAARNGLQGVGLEISELAIRRSRAAGLTVFHATQSVEALRGVDTIVLLQALEHLADPLRSLRQWVDAGSVQQLIIAVPCYEALVGHSTHPLLWPPHHATIWSELALRRLATELEFTLVKIAYDTPTFNMYLHWQALEPAGALKGLLRLPANRLGMLTFNYWKWFRRAPWARRFHSILGLLERSG